MATFDNVVYQYMANTMSNTWKPITYTFKMQDGTTASPVIGYQGYVVGPCTFAENTFVSFAGNTVVSPPTRTAPERMRRELVKLPSPPLDYLSKVRDDGWVSGTFYDPDGRGCIVQHLRWFRGRRVLTSGFEEERLIPAFENLAISQHEAGGPCPKTGAIIKDLCLEILAERGKARDEAVLEEAAQEKAEPVPV